MNKSSCGHCCHAEVLCDKCLVHTLECNGLDPALAPEIKGIKQEIHGYNRDYSWEFSDLHKKLEELRDRDK